MDNASLLGQLEPLPRISLHLHGKTLQELLCFEFCICRLSPDQCIDLSTAASRCRGCRGCRGCLCPRCLRCWGCGSFWPSHIEGFGIFKRPLQLSVLVPLVPLVPLVQFVPKPKVIVVIVSGLQRSDAAGSMPCSP